MYGNCMKTGLLMAAIVALFGAARCIYGSNFPIERMWTSYDRLVGVMDECLAPLDALERQAIFHDNAQRLYRL